MCAPSWFAGFPLGMPPIWLLVPDLGLPPNRLLCAKLGLAPINLLGCGSCLVCVCGMWSCGWGLGWYKGDCCNGVVEGCEVVLRFSPNGDLHFLGMVDLLQDVFPLDWEFSPN